MLKKITILGIAVAALGIALPANAELAETYSPDEETIVGGREVSLPSVPVTPWRYALPMEISIVENASITTDTPITDEIIVNALTADVTTWSNSVSTWGEAVAGCLDLSPEMVRQTVAGEQPFIVSDAARTIHLNANSAPVCPL